ncbi:hypothetical protein Vadar_028123 [Vaccinium darrowii]|uniref:Uncharacterized protein n=1 Tax=Vaccinium darrowii TaxID=229202 RepID=A0ACB7XUH2_9ERIC|nr:hypothetical protein Vadar_028123 [Vaccinium darrowii]
MYTTLQRQMEICTKTLQETQQQNQELWNQLQRSEGPQGTKPQPSNNVHNNHSQRAEGDQGSKNQDNGKQDQRAQDHPEDEDGPLSLMKAQIESLAKQVRGKAPTTIEELVQNTNSPFTPELMREPLPRKFNMPHLDTFSGTSDPLDHPETYKNLMMLQTVPDEIICRAFPITLKGNAQVWFNKLKPQSISNFKELSKRFVSYFIAVQKYSKPSTYLFSIRQGKHESLREYTSRFTKESMQVEAVEDQISIAAYIAGLNSG